MKKFICFLHVMVMSFLVAGLFDVLDAKAKDLNVGNTAIENDYSGSNFDDASSYAASAVSLNATNVELYAMNDWATQYISIPSSLNQSFQLKANGATITSCTVSQGDSVQVTNAGLITPAYTIWYWNGNMGSTVSSGQPGEIITREANFGTSVLTVTAGGQTFKVTVTLSDYANQYADDKMNDYIAQNINNSMSVRDKLEKICQFVASFNYSASSSGSTGMIVSGGGDCWASTSTILQMCKKLGITAWSRNGNKDPGAGSGHMNAMVQDGNKYYEADAGFSGTAPRNYTIKERKTLFSYWLSGNEITIYQYDGNENVPFALVIPDAIDGYAVTAIDDNFISRNSNVTSVSIPDTVTSIGKSAFNSCTALTKLNIPASVNSIGDFAFTNDNALAAFTCSPNNKTYCIVDGVLYNKNKSELISCPQAASVKIPNTVKSIGDYAFYYNKQIASITLPDSVTTVGEGAFAQTNVLEVLFPDSVTNIGQFALRDTNAKILCNSNTPAHKYGLSEKIDCILLDKNGVLKADDGNWYYYNNGRIATSYTGIRNNENGWWRIENGKVNFNYTGIAQNENGWWRIENGKVNFNYTGVTNNENGWWRVENGKVNFNFNGIAQNQNGWWLIRGGKVDFGANGVLQAGRDWWYIKGGKVQTNYTGIRNNQNGWWRIENGKVNFKYTGVTNNENGWWRVENGKVNFNFNGIAQNQNGWWLIRGGRVDFNANGRFWTNMGWKDIKNGKVQTR